jgi:glycosyltransferase involved in cell wall biosynthesis
MLSLLIPTRGRPHRLRELVESVDKTRYGDVEILTYVDDDDPSDYPIVTIRGKRIERARQFKALIPKATFDYLMICGDDCVFETEGWDRIMVSAFPRDDVALIYGNDGWKNVAGHGMFHRKLYDLTGVCPDEFEHFGPDTYLAEIFGSLKRLIQVPVMVKHKHFRNGKAERDETYDHPRKTGMHLRDSERLKSFRSTRMKDDIEILRAEIERFSGGMAARGESPESPRDKQA